MIQIPVPPAPPAPPEVFVTGGPPFESPGFLILFLAVIAAATLVLWPLVRALARRLEGKTGPGSAAMAELEDLRARVRELETTQGRLLELEERLDFTERILTQREPVRLPEGS